MKARIVYEGEIVDTIPAFQVGDFGETLQFNVVNLDDSKLDLSNATTIKFRAKRLDNVNDENVFLLDKAMTDTSDAANGIVKLTFADGDLSDQGSYAASIQIEQTGVLQSSIALGFLKITEDI